MVDHLQMEDGLERVCCHVDQMAMRRRSSIAILSTPRHPCQKPGEPLNVSRIHWHKPCPASWFQPIWKTGNWDHHSISMVENNTWNHQLCLCWVMYPWSWNVCGIHSFPQASYSCWWFENPALGKGHCFTQYLGLGQTWVPQHVGCWISINAQKNPVLSYTTLLEKDLSSLFHPFPTMCQFTSAIKQVKSFPAEKSTINNHLSQKHPHDLMVKICHSHV